MIKVVILGLGVVFSVLIILILMINIMKFLFNVNKDKYRDKEDGYGEIKKIDTMEVADEANEIAAVIAAVVAAMWNTSVHTLVVKSIKRIPNDNVPVWRNTNQ